MVEEKIQKTREEIFQDSYFEWVKTERQGDVCRFKEILLENDIEYIVFTDNSRVRLDLIGNVVLAHQHQIEILGDSMTVHPHKSSLLNLETLPTSQYAKVSSTVHQTNIDPVVAILEKTKKRSEKISITLTLRIPAVDLYNVIKENFDNAEDVLLQNVMDQIHDNLLRDALKKELQNIYQKKKKNNAGSI